MMAESSRRYNLRDTRKKPHGVLLEQWEVEYSKLISNENRRVPLEKVKTAIRSAFEDGMFEQWRITLKCPLSRQRIKVPARYADCTHIECFDLEALLRMKTQKNLRVCPICQKEVEKPLANLRIDEYIESVLSTIPNAMQVELLPDGSFTEILEEFVVESNVINDEEPFVPENNAPSFEIKQEASENDDGCITLSDGEDESVEEIVETKPLSLMPLNIDIKPEIDSSSGPEQTHCGQTHFAPMAAANSGTVIEPMMTEDCQAPVIKPTTSTERHLGNACSNPKKRRVMQQDKQSAGTSADVNAHSDQSSSEINQSSDSSEDENDESQIKKKLLITENLPRKVPVIFMLKSPEEQVAIAMTPKPWTKRDDVEKIAIRRRLLAEFKARHNAKQAADNVCDIFGKGTIKHATCQRWFQKFRKGNTALGDGKMEWSFFESAENMFRQGEQLEKNVMKAYTSIKKTNFKRVPLNDKQSTGSSAAVKAHTTQSSSQLTSESSDLRRDTVIIEQRPHTFVLDHQSSNPTQKMLLNVPNDSAQKKKITTISINIFYGTASFTTSEGQKYADLPLSGYLSILRKSEADVHGCQARIVFRIWTELRHPSVLHSQEKFIKFSQDIHSISHLWEDGRISVELYQCLDVAKTFLSIYDVYQGLFNRDRSILKCKILQIKCLNNRWPLSVITNVAHHCKQLILKQEHPSQNMGQTFLDILYTVTLPRHLEVTLELNYSGFEYDFIYQLEKRFQSSNAHYFKFKLLCFGFTRNKLLRNDYGTLEMTKVASHRDYRGFYRDTVNQTTSSTNHRLRI